MKKNKKFIIAILTIGVIAFAIEYSLPRKFSWNPTFKGNDKQPFGCYVFDDVLSSSLKNGYRVEKNEFTSFQNDSTENKNSFLSISSYQYRNKDDINVIIDLVNKGNKVMLVSNSFSYELNKKLGIEDHSNYFSIHYFRRYFADNTSSAQDSLILTDSVFDKTIYEFYPEIQGGYMTRKGNQYRKAIPEFEEDENEEEEEIILYETEESDEEVVSKSKKEGPTWADSLEIRTLATNIKKYPVALGVKIGEGELFLVSNSLIFTNYGVLDRENAGYIFSLLSYIDDLPVIRLEAADHFSRMEEDTPLRYFLSEPPLRWSIYFLIISILLFMFFAARRKQRIIPVIKAPANKTLEFTELIGTLYFQRKDYADLVHKKYIYFADQLKRNTYIDIEGESLSMDLCSRLSNKTGMQTERLYYLIERLQSVKEATDIDEEQMKEYIKQMNEILDKSR